MGSAIGAIIGLALGVLGFMVMRDPMRLSVLSPGEQGYYQRLVFDRWPRISLRIVGVLGSLLGMVIFSAALGALLRVRALSVVSDGLLVEMGILFLGAWVAGVVLFTVKAFRGQALDWFRIRKQRVILGTIAVYPPMTASMEKESRTFTIAFCVLVGLAVCAALYRH
jgi:hypothetical protein